MERTHLSIFDEQLKEEKSYWLQKLSGELVASGLPLDFRRRDTFDNTKHIVPLKIRKDTTDKLLQICKHRETLVFTVLVAALKVCLHKYMGVQDIIVGTTIHEQYGDIASLNKVLVLRSRINDSMTVKGLLENVRNTLAEAYTHQKYPFNKILDLLQIKHSNNRSPLFNVVAILNNINNQENIRHLKNDVTLVFSIDNGDLTGTIEYHPSLFRQETIELFGLHYEKILAALLEASDKTVSAIELLSTDKKQELVFDFNLTQQSYPKLETIHQLFEEQVTKTPDKIAVINGFCHLTYDRLNCRANQLAHHLQTLEVDPEMRIGICLEHSLEMIVALLGVLKVGGSYVPLDPAYPKARLGFILEDAQVAAILTQQRLKDKLPANDRKKVYLDTDWAIIAQESKANLVSKATEEYIAYIIYTSGSTGNPKGVKIQHSALVNYIWWAKGVYLQNEQLAFPLYSSLAFDLTVTSVYTPLITGNQIVIYPQDEKTFPLANILKDNRVGVLKLTPSHLSLIKNEDNRKSSIKRLIVGGEALEMALAQQIYDSFGGNIEIFNEYGPTEATVGCMIHQFDSVKDNRAFVPIGRPAANVQIYILDKSLEPTAENVIGELYISGDGLAQGYVNRPDLTAERFISNPFLPDQKMYKTGDLARWLPENIIEYMGRIDEQVKFHGYRVELNEIRCALNQYPQIRDSIVTVTRDQYDNDVMIAYYVSSQELETAQLRAFLSQCIIGETIPNIFVYLEKLPLTLNGKINYHALPTLEEARQQIKRTFVAPQNEVEQTITAIWQEALQLERIGVHDSFFDLGGHSLLMVKISSKLQEAFRRDISIIDMFKYPTISTLAQYLNHEQVALPFSLQSHERAKTFRASTKRQRQRRQRRQILKTL